MPGSDSVISRFCDMKHPLAVLLIIGLVIRIVIAPLFTFNVDLGYWAEVVDVFQNGYGLYGTQGYYYTPIWGYYLGSLSGFMEFIGMTDYGTYIQDMAHLINFDFKVNSFVTSIGFNFLVKLPLIIVDTIVAWLIYEFILKRTGDKKKALLGFALWFFSVFVITESVFHGMFDNMSVMFLLIAIFTMLDRKYFIAGMAFATSVLTKFFPLFFIFFMVAYVLRREGVDKNGAKQLGIAALGAAVASVIIYLPNIISGDLWQSLYFIAYRLGISRSTLASIDVVTTVAIVAAVVVLIGAVLFVISRYGPTFMEKMRSMDESARNKKCAKIVAIAATVTIFVVGMIALYTILTKTNTIENIGMKGVLLISIFSIFVEIYLAFRLLMLKDIEDDTKVMTILFLSALAVILWPPAPSYAIIMVPFICIYAAMVDRRFVKPCIIFMVLIAASEIQSFLICPTSLVYALTGNVDMFIPIYDFLVNPLFMGFSGQAVINFVPMIAAYLAMIYISYKWYFERYKGRMLWTS